MMEKILSGTLFKKLELRRIDIFGYQITLRMNQQSTYRTGLGGVMSIMVIGIMIFQFAVSFQSFLSKDQLNAISITEYDPKTSNSTISNKQLLFAIAIQQENFITTPFFNISLQQISNYRYQNGSQVQVSKAIQLVQCSALRFEEYFAQEGGDFSQQYFNSSSLNDYLCPEIEATFELGGTFTSSEYLYLQITISKCDEQVALNNGYECASDEDLQNYLLEHDNFKFQLYNINQIINPYKPDNDYRQIFLDDSIQYTFIPNQVGRSVDVYLKHYQIYQDNSLTPLSEIVTKDTYLIDQLETQLVTEVGKSTDYVRINFKRSPFKTTITRSYLKFDELLSNIGGIQQIVFFFVGILVTLYNKLQMMIELANRLYEFSVDSSKQQREQQEKLELINIALEQQQRNQREPGSSVNNSDEDDRPQNVHKTLIQQKEHNEGIKKLTGAKKFKAVVNYLTVFKPIVDSVKQQQKKESFRLILDQQLLAIQLNCKSGLEYFEKQIIKIIGRAKPIELSYKVLLNVLSCNRLFSSYPKIQLLNKGMTQVSEKIDIYNIVQNINEMSKLKEVVLSYNQQVMFNFTPKPLITLDEQAAQPTRDLLVTIKMDTEKGKLKEAFEKKNIFKYKNSSTQSDNYLLFAKIYNSYDDILRQCQDDGQSHNNINKQLIEKLGPELQLIFKLSKLIDFQSQNSTQQQVKTPHRRGAMQQKEQNVYAKMFDQGK